MSETRCCKSVPTEGLRMHYHQCNRAGVVEHKGKLYCKIHDPAAVQARQDKRSAKWEAEWAAKKVQRAEDARKAARAELCVAACDWMTDEEVKMMAVMSRTALVAILYNKI